MLTEARARLLDVLRQRAKRLKATYVKPITAEELADVGRIAREMRAAREATKRGGNRER